MDSAKDGTAVIVVVCLAGRVSPSGRCFALKCSLERYAWEAYECSHCKRSLKIQGRIQKAKELWMRAPVKFEYNHVSSSSGINLFLSVPKFFMNFQSDITRKKMVMFSHERGLGHFQTFILPHHRFVEFLQWRSCKLIFLVSGFIHHISPGQMGNQEADRIFEEYQKQASEGHLLFRRWPLRSVSSLSTVILSIDNNNSQHKCNVKARSRYSSLLKYHLFDPVRTPLLTNYFSQNCTLMSPIFLYVDVNWHSLHVTAGETYHVRCSSFLPML